MSLMLPGFVDTPMVRSGLTNSRSASLEPSCKFNSNALPEHAMLPALYEAIGELRCIHCIIANPQVAEADTKYCHP